MTTVLSLLGVCWILAVVYKLLFEKNPEKKRRTRRKRRYYDDDSGYYTKVKTSERYETRDDDFTQESDFVYQRREFLSNAEMSFFQVLRQVCRNDYYIAPKVGLWGLVKGEETEYGNERGWAKIAQKHLDFVLLCPRLMKPILVVELDDSSHWKRTRREKDEQKDVILLQANIPVLRVPARTSYDSDILRESINSKIRSFYRMKEK